MSSSNSLGKACDRDGLNDVASCFERVAEHSFRLESYSSPKSSTNDDAIIELGSYFTKRRDGLFHCVVILEEWVPRDTLINYTQDFTGIPGDIDFYIRAKQSDLRGRSVEFAFKIMEESFMNLRDSLSKVMDHKLSFSECGGGKSTH